MLRDTVEKMAGLSRFFRYSVPSALLIISGGYTGLLAYGYYFGVVRRHRLEAAWIVLVILGGLAAWIGRQDGDAIPANKARTLTPGHRAALLALCCAGSFVAYLPSLHIGLFSDDFSLMRRAVAKDYWNVQAVEVFRPFILVLWNGVFLVFGQSPFSLHTLNLVLHGANAFLVVLVGQRFGLNYVSSIFAGALFLLFPASVEPVVWPSGIQDVLMTTACLAFVLLASAPYYHLSIIVGLMLLMVGLLTKETAVIAPILAALVWLQTRSSSRTRGLAPLLLGLALCVAYAAWRISVIPIPAGYALKPTRYLVKEMLSRPFGGLAVPWSTRILDALPVLGLLCVWSIVLLFVRNVFVWRSSQSDFRRAFLLATWMIIAVLPVYSAFFISGALQGSRYLYLPACAWVILVATSMESFFSGFMRGGRFGRIVASLALLSVSAAGVRWHLGPWVRAAQLRDQVLRSAEQKLRTTSCPLMSFEGLPDSLEGAYIFRNGFYDALSQGNRSRVRMDHVSATPECRFRWSGVSFVPSSS